MRIVFVANHGSVHTRRWVAFFAKRGHDVTVVTCGGGDAVDLEEDGTPVRRGYTVHELGPPRFGKLGYVLKIFRARALIRRLQPEVVHAHWVTSYGLLALCAGVRPLVVTAHGDDVLIAPRNPLFKRIVQRVLRAAELITVPSDTMRDAVSELLGPEHPREISVFQYGVEVRRLTQVSERERAALPPRAERPVRIVSARAFLHLYRIDVLLDALARLRDEGLAFECELFGDGPLRAELEQQAERLGLADSCRFHGAVSPLEVERWVARSDVYVSVAESDGVSLALLEALALGAVPVLSDIPANRDWVHHGHSGALTAIEPAAVADAIRTALGVDPLRAAADNQARVAERADRETNLAACELLVDCLRGVTFERSDEAAV